MEYSCRIAQQEMICVIQPDQDFTAPVFCFSGMAPMEPVSGGALVKSVGSYTEIALPDLAAGEPHEVVIRYQDGFTPSNRAWMPLGPYLRCGTQVVTLPPTPAGRRVPAPVDLPKPEGLILVPQPSEWVPAQGVLLTSGFAFDDPSLAEVAALATRRGLAFRGDTPLEVKSADMGEDAYEIHITEDGATILASSYGGRFYGGVTLLNLLRQGPIPCGRIVDSPRFGWRGQHLDTARHFYQPQTILDLLDAMALLKMNRFHWHFADDEAFRLEVTCLPELWQKTALRGEGQMMPGLFSGTPVEGGSYSIETAQQIIAHAKRLNIEVMPEIETPAHALCITTLFPETLDAGDNGTERSVQGYQRNVMNPAMPKSWEIMEALVAEVGAVFPFGHLHLGFDELPKNTWMSSPKARALMKEHGLETTQDLQGWTGERLAAFTVQQGLRPAAWEEAAQGRGGGIGHNAILFSWTGQEAGLEAARAGYDVVMTPAQHVYMDMAHSGDVDDWGANWAAFVDLADTVSWDPVPDPALSDRIIGVQGAFWSEFTTQDSQMWPMILPRILGVAAMCWQSHAPTPEEIAALAQHVRAFDSFLGD